jgi:hypothetical protein
MDPESLVHKITNVLFLFYMGLDRLIWMRGNPFLGPFERVGPESLGNVGRRVCLPALGGRSIYTSWGSSYSALPAPNIYNVQKLLILQKKFIPLPWKEKLMKFYIQIYDVPYMSLKK